MKDAKSILDGLLGQTTALVNGQGAADVGAKARDLGDKAKETWNNQSTLGKGAIAGGLLGILFTGGGRRLLGTGLKVGGAALIGSIAYKAYEDWKSGKSAQPEDGPVALPRPDGTVFLPDDDHAANDLSARLLQAMVSAAKADGHVTMDERARINDQLGALGIGPEAAGMIAAELDAPLDAGRIAALARSPEEAAEIYTASLLAVDPDGAAEKGYLAMLAARLGLEPGLVAHLHAKAAQVA